MGIAFLPGTLRNVCSERVGSTSSLVEKRLRRWFGDGGPGSDFETAEMPSVRRSPRTSAAARRGDIVLALISGGGSAVLELLVGGIELEDMRAVNALLQRFPGRLNPRANNAMRAETRAWALCREPRLARQPKDSLRSLSPTSTTDWAELSRESKTLNRL